MLQIIYILQIILLKPLYYGCFIFWYSKIMITANLARQTLETMKNPSKYPYAPLSFLQEEAQKQLEAYIKDIDELLLSLKSTESQPIENISSLQIVQKFLELIEIASQEEKTRLIVACITWMYAYENYKDSISKKGNTSQTIMALLKRHGIPPADKLLQAINFDHAINPSHTISATINRVQENARVYWSPPPQRAIENFLRRYPTQITKEVLLQRLQEESAVLPFIHQAVLDAVHNWKEEVSCIIDSIPWYTDRFIPSLLEYQWYEVTDYDVVWDGMWPGSWNWEPFVSVDFQIPK